ncbi:MAG TPA: TrmH family RNA methyltransferase [Acidimicrobiales bacterium]
MTRQLDSTGLKRLHRAWRRRPAERVGLLLDNVQSPFNVGAILRTAAALRVDHLWLAGETASPTHAKTAKTALGTQRYLEWTWHDTAADAAGAARAAGYRVVGLELADDAAPLPEARLDGPVCLMVGHEDRGLPPASLALCDEVAFIPQLGRVGSLNVATATAIALYEVRRRSWTSGDPGDAGDGARGPARNAWEPGRAGDLPSAP